MSTDRRPIISAEIADPEAIQSDKFDAIAALALTYAKVITAFMSSPIERLRFTDLRSGDEENWADTQALLSTSKLEFRNVIEEARFGVDGWICLKRYKADETFICQLQLVGDKNTELFCAEVDPTVVGEAIIRGISPLAAALAADSKFRAILKGHMLDAEKHPARFMTYEKNRLRDVSKKVEAKAKSNATRV